MTSRADILGRIAREIMSARPERYTASSSKIDDAIKEWKEPSDAQREAENYHKPKIHWNGLTISIENPKGSRRRPEWEPLEHHYGYINKTEGSDGEHVDVFVCSHPESELVFVVDQEHPSGRFDEHKVVIGARNESEARKFYLSNYEDGWHCGPITAMTVDQFRAWLEHGDTTTRVAEQVSKYAARYGFYDIHPVDGQTKRFIAKHKSLTLAQTVKRPPTTRERNAYREYVDFLKVGGTKPLPFRKWLEFHRAETLKTLHHQQETPDDDSVEEVPEADSPEQDSQPTRTENTTEAQPEGFARVTGSPTRHSLRALHDFAAAAFDTYYQDSVSE